MEKFYITTTIPYVNAEPHIGFAWELVQADAISRYRRLLGDEVFFSTGTDEHGLKIYRKALEENKDPQNYVDEYAEKYKNLKQLLNLSDALHFIRTTDEHHKKAAQEFWKRCEKNKDIYKGFYKTKYCVGCELEKTDSELENGHCSIHPNLDIEIIEEENYFFKFSGYGEKLLDFYEKNSAFVLPESKFNEIKNFVKTGLNDFSISRLKEKMPWGVPVPGDEKHVMYVWFDALVNYISTLGWPFDPARGKPDLFKEFWGTKEHPNGVQLAGKDQVRQQAAMWQAMLMSADLPNSKQIIIHGFITSNGEKMSKSLGNVIDPYEVVQKYGADAFRYWLMRELNTFEDGDFSWGKFKERYNADLANGLGNLVARITALGEKISPITYNYTYSIQEMLKKAHEEYDSKVDTFRFNEALEIIWRRVAQSDAALSVDQPWYKEGNERADKILSRCIDLAVIADLLEPFLPVVAQKIKAQISYDEAKKVFHVKKMENLFPRID